MRTRTELVKISVRVLSRRPSPQKREKTWLMLRQTKNLVPQKTVKHNKPKPFQKQGCSKSRTFVQQEGLGNVKVDTAQKMKESKQRVRERLSAKRVLDRISKIPIDNCTQREVQSLAWAKEKLDELDKTSTTEVAVKRQRSSDGDAPGAKKSRSSHRTNTLYSEVLKDSIEMAVVDRPDPDGSITPSNWRLVADALADVFLEVI